jgi:hypothetical protein
MSVSFTILGQPYSKSNSRRIIFSKGKVRSIKSRKALDYVEAARAQIPKLEKLMEGELSMTLHIYYSNERPDMDETLILDILQGYLYENDRQVRERHCYHYIDKTNPRSEITITQRKK